VRRSCHHDGSCGAEWQDLGADSLDMVEIGMDLEKAFGLQYNAIADSLLITVGDTYVQVERAVNPA